MLKRWKLCNLGLNVNKLFRIRDLEGCRRYYIYVWKRGNIVVYIGRGTGNRYINHHNDELSYVQQHEELTCEILVDNLTEFESRLGEAYLLQTTTRRLTKKGQHYTDPAALINKRIERNYRGLCFEWFFKEYLNLDGNNCWETLRRKINYY